MALFWTNIIVLVALIILKILAFITIALDFNKSIEKIQETIESLQEIPQRNHSPILQRPVYNLNIMQNRAPEIEISEDNMLNNGFINEGSVQERSRQIGHSINQQISPLQRSYQREVVRSFDRDIKLLKKKLEIVKLLRFFFLGYFIIMNIAMILGMTVYIDKPYILVIWNNLLLTLTFFVFTWFFNYRHKYAFIYSNRNNRVKLILFPSVFLCF